MITTMSDVTIWRHQWPDEEEFASWSSLSANQRRTRSISCHTASSSTSNSVIVPVDPIKHVGLLSSSPLRRLPDIHRLTECPPPRTAIPLSRESPYLDIPRKKKLRWSLKSDLWDLHGLRNPYTEPLSVRKLVRFLQRCYSSYLHDSSLQTGLSRINAL